MKIIWHNNNFFPVHDVWEENNTVFFQTADVMKGNNGYEQQQLVHSMFEGIAKLILAGGYINNASFQTINIGRKFDHVDWEEVVDDDDIEYCETRDVVVINKQ